MSTNLPLELLQPIVAAKLRCCGGDGGWFVGQVKPPQRIRFPRSLSISFLIGGNSKFMDVYKVLSKTASDSIFVHVYDTARCGSSFPIYPGSGRLSIGQLRVSQTMEVFLQYGEWVECSVGYDYSAGPCVQKILCRGECRSLFCRGMKKLKKYGTFEDMFGNGRVRSNESSGVEAKPRRLRRKTPGEV